MEKLIGEIKINYDTYDIYYIGNNKYSFGCGEVILTRKQISDYFAYIEAKEKLEKMQEKVAGTSSSIYRRNNYNDLTIVQVRKLKKIFKIK